MPVVKGDSLTREHALYYLTSSAGWTEEEAKLIVLDVLRTGPLTMARVRAENTRRRAQLG